jgi:hypothetical protein
MLCSQPVGAFYSYTKKSPKKDYENFNKKYMWIVHVVIYTITKLEMKQILV